MIEISGKMMKAKLKALWEMRNGIILVVTPLVFLPLPLVIGTTEAGCAYIIALMAVYWCTEVLPLAVTALLPAVLFPLFGIMQSKDVCMQYLKDTNMLFVGGLMVAVAVEHWNLHKRIALRVLLMVGVRPALLMLGFMGVTAFLSMWISNTATTAMMVPIVQAVLEQLNRPRPPGGEERNSPLPEAGEKPSEKQPDGPVVMNGTSVEMEQEEWERAQEEERLQMCKGLTLCVCYSASIGGTATLTGTGPNLVLSGQMNQLFPQNGDVINFASWFGFAFPNMVLMLALAWLWLQFVFIGFNFRKTWGCGLDKSEKEIAAYNVIREEHRKLGPMKFGEVSVLLVFTLLVVLWFTREPGFIDGWATHLFNSEKEFVTDATVAVFVAMLLFVLPSKPPRFFCAGSRSLGAGDSEGSDKAVPALLTWKVTQKKMPWSIVLLLGGGFALAKGSEASGLSVWLGDQMTPLKTIPPWAIAIILCLLISTFTECTSNVATATLFLPILASMCQSIGVNPLYVMIPCTLSTSFAFMLPVATPPNAIVFASGYLKVSDMAKTGVVMNIISLLCITLAINSWGRAMFRLDTFPSWANVTAN